MKQDYLLLAHVVLLATGDVQSSPNPWLPSEFKVTQTSHGPGEENRSDALQVQL